MARAATGKDGAASFFGDLAQGIEITEFTPHSYTAGEDDVHLLATGRFRSIATGREAAMTMHHYWRLRGGKVDRFRGSEDTAITSAVFAA